MRNRSLVQFNPTLSSIKILKCHTGSGEFVSGLRYFDDMRRGEHILFKALILCANRRAIILWCGAQRLHHLK